MKTANKIFMLFACVAISLTLSCSKEQATDLRQVENYTQNNPDFEKHIMDKAGPELGAQIMERMNNHLSNGVRTPIVYEGELCPEVVNSGTVTVQTGASDLSVAKFWSFSGDAGDVITIEVDRVTCEMDPYMELFFGSGDTTSLTYLMYADDEDAAACETCFAFFDPLLADFELPYTGVYTVAVWDNLSCAPAPYDYTIVATGQNPCIIINTDIVIDGCDTGVVNQTLPDGTTMQSAIDACAAGAGNHGEFVRCVARLTNAWKAAGLISGRDKGKIQSCAAGSNIP